MAKGDYTKITSEIGGKLQTDEVRVDGAGGEIESKQDKNWLVVKVLGRTGKTRKSFTYALSAVRSIEEYRRDAE